MRRVATGEHAHTVRTLGDRVNLKISRRLRSGIDSGSEMGRFLSRAGFGNSPAFLGALEYVRDDGVPTALAVAFEHVRNQGDGWNVVVDALDRELEQEILVGEDEDHGLPYSLSLIETVGRRTGELHRALAFAWIRSVGKTSEVGEARTPILSMPRPTLSPGASRGTRNPNPSRPPRPPLSSAAAPAKRMALNSSGGSSLSAHFEIIHKRSNLLHLFDFILTREDYGKSKPDPEPYLLALANSRQAIKDCLVIEDSPRGLAAAKAAGLDCWVIPSDETSGQDFSSADSVLGSIEEVAERLL